MMEKTLKPNFLYLLLLLLLGGILVLSGCVPAAAPSETPTGTPPPAGEATAESPEPEASETPVLTPEATPGGPETMTIEPGLEALIEQAMTDLAGRLEILPGAIQVLRAESVVWPDASLGCPQPGMVYIQVLQEGAQIILWADGLQYDYHYGGDRGLFLCEKDAREYDIPPQIDITKHTPPPRE